MRAGAVVTKDQDLFDGIDKGVLAQRVAEAKFLRALYLFEIVKNWGQAPLILEEPTSPSTTSQLNSGADFYRQILADLQDRKPAKEKRGAASQWAADFFRYDMTDSIRFAEMFGPAMEELMQHLRSGHDVMVNRWNEAVAYTGELFGGRKVWEWGNGYAEPQSFPLKSGETIQLTPAQVMSLYLLNNCRFSKGMLPVFAHSV